MILIDHIQRKPRSNRNYSVERVFDQLRLSLSREFKVRKVVVPYVSSGLINRIRIMLFVRSRTSRICHVTGDINFAGLLTSNILITTILDIRFLEEAKGIKKWILRFFWLYLPVKRSKIVTVISEATKDEILKKMPSAVGKIRVVPVALPQHYKFSPKVRNKVKPKILFIGTAPNKNLVRVAEALSGVACQLHIIGELSEYQREVLTSFNIDFVSAKNLSDEDVINKYCECDLLLFPSTYEGFGMPILEANAIGVPVVTSSILSMPEVAGNAAILVDPYSVNSIKEGVLRVLNNDDLYQDLVREGRSNIKRYSNKNITQMYQEVYKEII